MAALRWTDKELRERSLSMSDPWSQERIVQTIPPGATLIGVENTYSLPHNQPKVRCAFCHRAIHWSGWTALLDSGDRVLLGKKCGGDAFGSWDDAMSELEATRSRQFSLRRLDHLNGVASRVRAELPAWKSAARMSRRLLTQIEDGSPELFAALSGASRIGELRIYQRVQTRAVNNTGQMKLGFRIDVVPLGPCPGSDWLTSREPLSQIAALEIALADVEAALRAGTDHISSKKLFALRAAVDTAVSGMTRVLAGLHDVESFFSVPNLALIVRWSRAYSDLAGIPIGTAGTSLVVGENRYSLPANYSCPAGDALNLLQGTAEGSAHQDAA